MSNLGLPHTYNLKSSAVSGGSYKISVENCHDIETAPPQNFGGPGDIWSPEDLFVGAIADCFMMTFRAISKFSKIEWKNLECEANGVLDKVDGVIQFTGVEINAELFVNEGVDVERALKVMEKSEKNCLISNSIKPEVHLNAKVTVIE